MSTFLIFSDVYFAWWSIAFKEATDDSERKPLWSIIKSYVCLCVTLSFFTSREQTEEVQFFII